MNEQYVLPNFGAVPFAIDAQQQQQGPPPPPPPYNPPPLMQPLPPLPPPPARPPINLAAFAPPAASTNSGSKTDLRHAHMHIFRSLKNEDLNLESNNVNLQGAGAAAKLSGKPLAQSITDVYKHSDFGQSQSIEELPRMKLNSKPRRINIKRDCGIVTIIVLVAVSIALSIVGASAVLSGFKFKHFAL